MFWIALGTLFTFDNTQKLSLTQYDEIILFWCWKLSTRCFTQQHSAQIRKYYNIMMNLLNFYVLLEYLYFKIYFHSFVRVLFIWISSNRDFFKTVLQMSLASNIHIIVIRKWHHPNAELFVRCLCFAC